MAWIVQMNGILDRFETEFIRLAVGDAAFTPPPASTRNRTGCDYGPVRPYPR